MVGSILKMYQRPLLVILMVVLFVVGLGLGLFVGWVLLPVHYTFVDPVVDDCVVMIGTMYAQDNDLPRAQLRLKNILEWPEADQGKRVNEVLARYQLKYGASQPQQVTYIKTLATALGGAVPPTTVPGGSPTAPLAGTPSGVPKTPALTPVGPTPAVTPGGGGLMDLATSLLPICCVSLIVVVIVAVLALLWVNRRKLLGRGGPRRAPAEEGWTPTEGMEAVEGPHLRFTARYSLGQDNYEESFSIESPAGGFFGECGVSAAERLGKEGPDKVTAFDLWLFDVASRETVTKVLLSDWGYKDDPLRTQLISRGGVILAEKGKVVTLETQSLRVDVKVVDFDYGRLEGLPENSFFSALTLDIVARMKEGQNW